MTNRAKRLSFLGTLLGIGVIAIVLSDWWGSSRWDHMQERATSKQTEVEPEATNIVAATALDPTKPIRLAIGPIGPIGQIGDTVADLLTAELSPLPRFELVERRELERALREAELSLGGLARAADAVKAGRLVRADWFLLGSAGRGEATNAIFARLVDARSSVLRDVSIIALATNPAPVAAELAAFVQRAAGGSTNQVPRTFVALGGFEDLGLNNRFPGFPAQLRAYLTSAYQGHGPTLVERELISALMEEVQLDAAGLTEVATNAPLAAMQAAFWIVDGYYQSFEQASPEIDLVLRVERALGGRELVSLRGPPAEAIFAQVRAAVDATLVKGAQWPLRIGSKREAAVQFRRGVERSGLTEDKLGLEGGFLRLLTGGADAGADPERVRQNLNESIQAFEAAVLLQPDNRETRVYLATCLRHPYVNRLEEARNHLRDVLASPREDGWRRAAATGLAMSYQNQDPSQAIELLRTLAARAADPENGRFYSNVINRVALFAAPHLAERPLATSERQDLLEQGFMTQLEAIAAGAAQRKGVPQLMFRNAIVERNRTKAAERATRLATEGRQRFPILTPYLLAEAVCYQTDTNAPIVREFIESFEAGTRAPDQLPDPYRYFSELGGPYDWAFDHWMFDLVVRIANARQAAAAKQLGPKLGEDDLVVLAHTLYYLDKPTETIDLLDSFGNRSIRMPRNGPWGHFLHPYSAPAAAQAVRKEFKLPPRPNDTHTRVGKPYLTMRDPLAFELEGPFLWLAAGDTLYRFDPAAQKKGTIPFPNPEYADVTDLCLNETHLWIATAGSGLIEVDKTTHAVKRLGVSDGLLSDDISCLHLEPDQLWIGYGKERTGGLGRLDLKTRQATSFTPPLAKDALGQRAGWQRDKELDATNAPPRRKVTGIARGQSNEVWLTVEGKGIQRYRTEANDWTTFPSIALDEGVRCVVASPELVVVGAQSTSRSSVQPKRIGGLSARWPGQATFGYFSLDEGLPLNEATALTVEGNELWVGGGGFLAVISLPQPRVTRTFSFVGQEVSRVRLGGGFLWASATTNLFRFPQETKR